MSGAQNLFDPVVLGLIDRLIDDTLGSQALPENRDLAREMIVTALKSIRSPIGRGDLKLLNQSMRELRYAFKVFSAYRGRRKVTMFGSARTRPSHPEYRQARTFARRLRENGIMVITGAGPGIMRAGNEGAGRDFSFGINIRLPFEQAPNEFVAGDPKHIQCRYFFTRKLLLAKEADAAAFFPGGFGTHDEAFELLTLIQTGKAALIPMVFVDAEGGTYWRDWMRYLKKHMITPGRVSDEDMSLFLVTDSVDEALNEILGFYKNYHSMRYVGSTLVIRLKAPLPEASLVPLGRAFKDVIDGAIEQRGALPEEIGEPELASLPRLVMAFDRRHYGRLRQLIDAINKIPVEKQTAG